ncbi:hypothetical protein H9Q09_12020 [Aurantimonas sp. DM33-3]|uniref:hypothetical protein n=1 Tax=Aurantimonas sp. DM33-3 TaxID=2766955 RepID=UPI00165231CF|nr:hypothetical protein [Aurantimonas sp. DM33-3]MBC6716935.1 hypothetical protein [Aurantimonas sp. DM33-3]
MRNFIHGMEAGIFSALVGAANATGSSQRQPERIRVIRQTSRGSIDRLIAALRSETKRANDLADENEVLRRRLAAANRAALTALQSSKR